MEDLEFPRLDWLERYKRMYQAYDTAVKEAFYHELEQNGMDAGLQLLIRMHKKMSASLGKNFAKNSLFRRTSGEPCNLCGHTAARFGGSA